MKLFLKYLCTFILCLAVIEAILFFGVNYKTEWLKAKRLVYLDYDENVGRITDADLKRFREQRFSIYDKGLGWVLKPDSAGKDRNTAGNEWTFSIDHRSARVNPVNVGEEKISTYGDSFTFCHEVNDDQTWQYFLSKLTGTNVANLGVPGYGSDQALLRLKHNRETGVDKAKVVMVARATILTIVPAGSLLPDCSLLCSGLMIPQQALFTGCFIQPLWLAKSPRHKLLCTVH